MEQYVKKIEEKWNLSELKIISKFNTKGGREVNLIGTTEDRFVIKMFPPELDEITIIKYTNSLEYIANKIGKKLAPSLLRNTENALYSKIQDRFVYIMEYIEGRQLKDTPPEEYKLGQATAFLHTINDYHQPSCLDIRERVFNMKNRFFDCSFKKEYDEIVDSLPDFDKYKQTFIHTDIGPHNARMTNEGNVLLIDFDDAGMGSPFIDIGYPLITQFVEFNKETKEIKFNYENAKAFYQGYYSITNLTLQEKKLIFDGAVFMQLMYMPCYGPQGVQDMWDILKFGINNKDELLSTIL